MLLLVSGSSGVGKTTARIGAAKLLGDRFEAVELAHLGPIPAALTVAWRQETVEAAVRRAIELDAQGRHLLLAGDPVPAGEILAAPSADRVDIAVCLLDADEAAQNARLDARRDPIELRPNHLGFAAWMRRHATDPAYLPEVLTNGAWPPMRWDRWVGVPGVAGRWRMTVLDTSALAADEVAEEVAEWAEAAVRGEAPIFRAGWHVIPAPDAT